MKAINLRFGPSMYEDARGALSKLQQTITVAIYQAQFEELSTKVNGLSEQFLLSLYISGLKPEIRCEILVVQHQSLLQAMVLARLQEDKLNELKQFLKTIGQRSAIDLTSIKVVIYSTYSITGVLNIS